jgi:hypothetical protein
MAKDDAERISSAVADLCEPLHDVFTWADQHRREKLAELDGRPEYQWLGTHHIRAMAHFRMSGTAVDLGGWKLTGNHARNGELWLTDDEYRVRLLHAMHDKDVPCPGPNGQRRLYYRNVPLPQMPQAPKLFGPPDDRLLFVWRIHMQTGTPIFRVVRPIGNWRYGDHALTDIDFILPDTAADLSALQFEPTDEGMELDIPDERKDMGDAGGFAG